MGSEFAIVETYIRPPVWGIPGWCEEAVVRKLAACVNVERSGVRSAFLWKGRMDRPNESRVSFKTTAKRADELVKWIRDHHAYDVPCIVVLEARFEPKEYADWVRENTQPR